ncbi:three-Cys-motif partner protein [Idiomarina fontislapidosi]|uniref:three-Cys-motif partner protein TcmP n=1 Tax=Idiomarina fontislapidosi TaxID=263723 RepID=UPI000D8E9DA8|nr:three-Cys-motif partner protein TcmP [Idiomarina fontislapidosi]PYE30813.1 three-Cys-motif partner protein [Idiomarina fontislapidosi]
MAHSKKLWALDPHTKGKHLVLKEYLDAWLPIVGTVSDELVIIDGFSGPGEYAQGEPGSPQIMLDAFQEHSYKNLIRGNVTYHFVEKHPERFMHLEQLVSCKYKSSQKRLKYEVHNESFNQDLCTNLLQTYDSCSGKKSCFIMIDPFGVSDTPMELVKNLIRRPKVEIFISIMYEHLNRFKKQNEFQPHLNALFGTDNWQEIIDIDDSSVRHRKLVELYKEQLKKSGASQVIHFDLYRGNKLIYTIFFASNHWKGSDKMKAAIWKAIPDGSFRYVGDDGGLLNNSYDKDYSLLINQIQERLHGLIYTVSDILEYIGSDRTGFPTGGVKKNVLKPMEKNNLIEPINDKRKKKFTYPDNFQFRILPKKEPSSPEALTENMSLI